MSSCQSCDDAGRKGHHLLNAALVRRGSRPGHSGGAKLGGNAGRGRDFAAGPQGVRIQEQVHLVLRAAAVDRESARGR